MTEHGDDEIWRTIVDNYGERAQLTDEPDDGTRGAPSGALPAEILDPPADDAADALASAAAEQADDPALDRYFPDEHFTPPPVPRPSRPAASRLAAWVGTLGVPAALLVTVLFDLYLPQVVGLLMLAWFVGGFGYLVWSMPRSPRAPWDDGAQV